MGRSVRVFAPLSNADPDGVGSQIQSGDSLHGLSIGLRMDFVDKCLPGFTEGDVVYVVVADVARYREWLAQGLEGRGMQDGGIMDDMPKGLFVEREGAEFGEIQCRGEGRHVIRSGMSDSYVPAVGCGIII